MRDHKKAQMEIFGLAIVVVLILVATIFIVRFLALKSPTNYRKDFVSSEIASNFISAFLNTAAADCSQLTMTELLQDCAKFDGKCEETGGCIKCSDGSSSCSFVKLTAQKIFQQTLDKWKVKYELLAYTPSSNLFDIVNPDGGAPCRGEKISKLQPIPVFPQGTIIMYVKLDICG